MIRLALGLIMAVLPVAALALERSPVPLERPQPGQPRAISPADGPVSTLERGIARSPLPQLRSERAARRIIRAGQRRLRRREATQRDSRGSVCGVAAIKGAAIAPVQGRIRGCGVPQAVRVTSVAGIALSQGAVMDCRTARALNAWVDQAAVPAFERRGGGLAGLKVAAHYACRTRNNQPGGRISEHGKGRAIDIAGFRLQNGELVSVLTGWRDSRYGPILQRLHRSACGPFGTVLGPNSDRFHQDHFHFDTARYRSGSYCR